MTKSIINESVRDEAFGALRNAKRLGKRRPHKISRDIGKGKTQHAVFICGGGFEVHANEEFGDIFVYQNGLLKHEEVNRERADEVIAMARRIA